MKELIAFLLPPATACVGMRINRLIVGNGIQNNFGLGLRFALGFATGMVIFSQTLLLASLGGINASGWLAWTALVWGALEAGLLLSKLKAGVTHTKFQVGHLWLLFLLPTIYAWWVLGQLSTLEGTLEFDANAFWVFKSKILYLEQGKNLISTLHQSNLGYAHLDYPMLVPCLYTLNYGAIGGVDEFVNKVWPFWMIVALCLAILSLARVWQQPKPLPVFVVMLVCYLPATLQFIRQEGGTIPMVFFTSMTALLMMMAIINKQETAVATGFLLLAGCVSTKFEGVIYAALWGGFILIYSWQRGWLKSQLIWKAIIVAAICLIPYLCLRMSKPVLHPESGWIKNGLNTPSKAIRRLPQIFLLDIGGRLFDKKFFEWKTEDKDHVYYTGSWSGLKNFENPELSLLPWLTVLITALSFWKKPRQRSALGILLLIMLGQFLILSLAMSCLASMQKDVSQVIEFSGFELARYYYPFFLATFLGIISIWFTHSHISVSEMPTNNSAPTNQTSRPKKRR